MKVENISIGVGPLSGHVYVGRMNKEETQWLDKKQVTEEVIVAVAESMAITDTEHSIAINGKQFRLQLIEDLTN